MSRITPPEQHIDWATASDAYLSDPGVSKSESGYVTGEFPGAQHLNYLWRQVGTSAKFINKTMAGECGFANLENTGTLTFGTDVESLRFTYSDNGGTPRWYCVRAENDDDVEVFDSSDGYTWSAGTKLDDVTTDGRSMTGVATDGMLAACAINGKCFYSSDTTAANFDVSNFSTFAAITEVRQLVYDAGNNLWIAAGADGSVNGKIETASTPDGTWTVRATSPSGVSPFACLATDGDGNSVALTSGFGIDGVYSPNGTTWYNSTTEPSTTFNRIIWSEPAQLFMGIQTGTNHLFTSEDGDNWQDQDLTFGVDIDSFLNSPTVTYLVADATTTSKGSLAQRAIYAITAPSPDRFSLNAKLIGYWVGDLFDLWGPTFTMEVDGGGGVIPFLNSQEGLVTMTYGRD